MKYVAKVATTGADSYFTSPNLCLCKPSDLKLLMDLNEAVERALAKHNGYMGIETYEPFRPRTFGPKKTKPSDPGYQANHLNGHLSQLAIHFGYTKQEMKEIMKDDVPEWPVEKRTIGKRVKIRPVSEATVSIEVESKAIEWTHLIAAEEGIKLEEGEE